MDAAEHGILRLDFELPVELCRRGIRRRGGGRHGIRGVRGLAGCRAEPWFGRRARDVVAGESLNHAETERCAADAAARAAQRGAVEFVERPIELFPPLGFAGRQIDAVPLVGVHPHPSRLIILPGDRARELVVPVFAEDRVGLLGQHLFDGQSPHLSLP